MSLQEWARELVERWEEKLLAKKAMIRPEEPSIHHLIGTVGRKDAASVTLQEEERTITADIPEGMGVEAIVGVFSLREDPFSKIYRVEDSRPFPEVVRDIGRVLEEGVPGIHPDVVISLPAGTREALDVRKRCWQAFYSLLLTQPGNDVLVQDFRRLHKPLLTFQKVFLVTRSGF